MTKVIQSPDVSWGAEKIVAVGVGMGVGVGGRESPTSRQYVGRELDSYQQNSDQGSKEVELLIEKFKEQERQAESAKQKLKELEESINRVKKEAEESGYKDGYQKAGAECRNEFSILLNTFKQLTESLEDKQKELMIISEEAALEIAFSALAEIMGQVPAQNDLLEAYVQSSINRLENQEGLVIHLCPSDYSRIMELENERPGQWGKTAFKADALLETGDCKVFNKNGGLETRLDQIMVELKNSLLSANKCNRVSVE